MKRWMLALGGLLVAGGLGCAGVIALGSWSRGQEADVWPDIADEPPLDVADLQEPDAGWHALEPLLAGISSDDRDILNDTVSVEGPPIDPGFWVRIADQVEAIDDVLQNPTITSPGVRKIDDPLPAFVSLVGITEGLCLRGWTSHASSMYAEAVDDMLAADALGKKVADGAQTLIGVMVGLRMQSIALQELEELLAVTPDPAAHARAEAGLAAQAAAEGLVVRAVLRECNMMESMYRDLGDNPALLSETTSIGEDPNDDVPEPSALDRLAALRYDADATIAQHRRNCRAQQDWLGLPPNARGAPPPLLPPELSDSAAYNQIGRVMLEIGAPSFDGYVDEEHATRLRRSGLRLLTAARRYADDHDGTLPSDERALVPDYLPSPLADPFSVSELAIADGRIQTGHAELTWAVTLPEAAW